MVGFTTWSTTVPLENVQEKFQQLQENVEDRTNWQMRETLIFKNIPEETEESYDDTR